MIKEGILHSLYANGGFRTMARVQLGLVRQSHNLIGYALHQLRVTSARQVSSANTPTKNYITTKCQFHCLAIIYNMSRCMSWRVSYLKLIISCRKHLPMFHPYSRLWATINFQPKQCSPTVKFPQRKILAMQSHRCIFPQLL